MLCFLVLGAMLLTMMSGCDSAQETAAEYECLTAQEAKALMDSERGYVILDVRTAEEFETGHIEGAMLLPDSEIRERAANVLPDKQQLILVYCRSGRRSKNAAAALVEMGYRNIKEFGGVIDWPYGLVK